MTSASLIAVETPAQAATPAPATFAVPIPTSAPAAPTSPPLAAPASAAPSPAATASPAAASSPLAPTRTSPPVATTPKPAAPTAPPMPRMELSAQSIVYDGDHFIMIARGNVQIHIADGTFLRARYFAMDVKANRYLIAGHIQIDRSDGTHLAGAAYADFLAFGRAYYLPVINGPDRWTIVNNDFQHPLRGRLNPGDAFSMPEDSHSRPYISARKAIIVPSQEIRFDFAKLDTGLTVVPVPNYVLNLSKNPNFAQNSLSGAHFDASYPFAGSSNASTAFHIRENSTSGLFAAIEQRLVGPKDYLVGSISPLDKEQKQYNLLGLDHLSSHTEIDGFAQENAFQQGFAQPLDASAYLNGRITQALKNSYLQFTVNQYYQSLLGEPPTLNGCTCYGDNPDHVWVPNHQVQVDLNWIGVDEKIGKLPLKYRLRSGYGWAHDAFGITEASTVTNPVPLVGVNVPTIAHDTVGGTLYSTPIHVFKDAHGRIINFNASLDKQEESFSLPHQIGTTNSAFSFSKTIGTKAAAFLAYNVSNVLDKYGSQQLIAYPTAGNFSGFGTSHTLSGSVILTPNPNFNLNFIGQHGNDYYGNKSNSVSAEVRARLLPHLTVDISRIYYWGPSVTQHWSPAFGLLVGS